MRIWKNNPPECVDVEIAQTLGRCLFSKYGNSALRRFILTISTSSGWNVWTIVPLGFGNSTDDEISTLFFQSFSRVPLS